MTSTMAAPSRRKSAKKTCETCGGRSGQHVAACPDRPERCTIQLDGERCSKDAPHTGEPHEAKSTGGTLTWGYPDGENFENQGQTPEEAGAITTVVDGEEAQIVLDGTTGEPTQPELIATPIEDRIRAIGRKETELDEARREKKRASEHVKALEEEHELMVRALVAQVDGGELPLPLAAANTKYALDEDEEESGEAQLTGAERRALAMTDESQQAAQGATKTAETQPLSTQQPGLYVSESEGPEE